jgi:hypothetical protein
MWWRPDRVFNQRQKQLGCGQIKAAPAAALEKDHGDDRNVYARDSNPAARKFLQRMTASPLNFYNYKFSVSESNSPFATHAQATYLVTVSADAIHHALEQKSLPANIPVARLGEVIARTKCAELFKTTTGAKQWKFTLHPFDVPPAEVEVCQQSEGVTIRELK